MIFNIRYKDAKTLRVKYEILLVNKPKVIESTSDSLIYLSLSNFYIQASNLRPFYAL